MGRGTNLSSTRRGLLNGAAGVAGIATGHFAGVAGADTARAAGADVTEILAMLATAESLAIALYKAVVERATFHIGASSLAQIRIVLDAEMRHLETVRSLGGRAPAQQYFMPERMLRDAGVFVDTAWRLENAFAGAYLAATRQFAESGYPALAATAALLSASEAHHLALLAYLAGLPAQDLTLAIPTFHRVSEAGPVLAPFLTRGARSFKPIGVSAER